MQKKHKGFTVLEFLIVVAIMAILIGLILVGLTNARVDSRDQARITNIQNIVVGLTQFHDICRVYPAVLSSADPSATCFELGGKTIKDIIPEIDSFAFNAQGSDYLYTGLADASDNLLCTGFHIGVKLEGTPDGFASSRSAFGPSSYGSQTIVPCGNGVDFEAGPGALDSIFDIKK